MLNKKWEYHSLSSKDVNEIFTQDITLYVPQNVLYWSSLHLTFSAQSNFISLKKD